jgi:hypothetical protein
MTELAWKAWPWAVARAAIAKYQIDDLVARESGEQNSDGAAAKESSGTRQER